MNALKKAFDLYLKSSTHVALAVVAFAGVTYCTFDLPPDSDLLLFIFFGTVTGYNFVKYAQVAGWHHFSLPKNLRIIQFFSLFCFLALIWYALWQPFDVLAAAACGGGMTAVYALPVFGKTNLRSISGAKIFVIAFVWACVTVILPLLNAGQAFGAYLIVPFVQRILLVIVLTLPFDIRDLRVDNNSLGTIPQQFGIKNTLLIAYALLAVVVLSELLMLSMESGELIILLMMTFMTALLVRQSVQHRSKYFTSFWIEGVPIIWWGLLLVTP